MPKLTIVISIIAFFLFGVFVWERMPRWVVEERIDKKFFFYGFFGEHYDIAKPILPDGYNFCDERTINEEERAGFHFGEPTTTMSFFYCYKKTGQWVWPER